MKRHNMYLLAGMLTLALVCGCDDDDDDESVPATSGAAVSSPVVSSSSSDGGSTSATPTETTPTQTTKTEYGAYDGRHNGDRPTWRWTRTMRAFPATFTLNIPGCYSNIAVKNNGTRFVSSQGVIVKQSDVAGRGVAVVAPSSCRSTQKASITYKN
ncbi:MAG: hypothetical protein LBU39_04020 [Desulfobulbaceae bacterium]|jgi:hypothetical protein|nr:hypothetical protein [Desulfobulbaceae bacterium]